MRHEITTIAAIGAGGAVGAMGRHFISGTIMRHLGFPAYPFGTLFVNILGAFLMGMIVEGVAVRWSLSAPTQSFLTTGMLGGLTTFSTFSLETLTLMQQAEYARAAANVVLSVVACIGAAFVGMALARQL